MFLVDLVVSKKGAKFVKSVKENILIIYAPLCWREERAPICSKFYIMDIEKFDFDSLTDEQFNKFIWSLDALKAKLNRVSVDEQAGV